MIDIILFLGLLLVILCVGRFFQERIQPTTEPLLDLLLSAAFGTGALVLLFTTYAWIGIFTPLIITLTLGILLVLTSKYILWIIAACRTLDYSWIRQKPLLSLLLLMFAIINLIGALSPTTDSDGLGYHLAIPKYYLETGAFAYHPMISSTWPMTAEMLYGVGIALSGDILAKLIHYFFGILCALATYWLARHYLGHDHGIIAATLFYTIPIVAIESGIAYNDLFLTYFFVLGFGLWMMWIRDTSTEYLPTAAILLGISASTKWNGPISVIILTAMTLWVLRKTIRIHAKAILEFILISAFFPSIWYAKNIILNGNPFGPFLEGIFDGVNWTSANTEAYVHSVKSLDLGLSHLFTAPIKLFLMPSQYGELTFLGPLLLMFVPIGMYFWRSPESKFIVSYSLLSYIVWWGTSQQSRLLIPLFPLLAVIASVGILDNHLSRIRTPLMAIILLSIILNLAFPLAYHGKATPYILGLEDTTTYLSRIRPVYPAITYINEQTPYNSTIIMFGEIHAYWLDRPFLYECAAMQGIINYDRPSSEIYTSMKSVGITHVLLNHNVPFCPGMEAKLRQEPFNTSLIPLFTKNNVQVMLLQ